MKTVRSVVQPRFRVIRGQNIALGPGKVELLEHIQAAGSITDAAQRMDMSYMRAWTLVKMMERSFKKPLIVVARGGAGHGGARLTENGKRVLKLYREIEKQSLAASRDSQRRLLNLLRA